MREHDPENEYHPLGLDASTREGLWRQVIQEIEGYLTRLDDHRVAPRGKVDAVFERIDAVSFDHPMEPAEAVKWVADGLWKHQMQTPHPRYFGLFNPTPTTMGIAADAMVAAFNPQLASFSHSPFAVAIERHVIGQIASKFGQDPHATRGSFTSGGAEANHTALLTAMVRRFPEIREAGLRALPKGPVLYVSGEAHHSFLKASRLSGLGTGAVREAPVDDALRLDVLALEKQIAKDRRDGFEPFMLAATAGTTGAGIVDPLPQLADLAMASGLWFHVDAAWGGAAALVPELRSVLDGIERADSITFDAHKWLSVPMGAGIYLTRHPGVLHDTFAVATGYMPRPSDDDRQADPYAHSMQWSRRFIGLKAFLSLAVAGWDGYARALRQQVAMGDRLRERLTERGWNVINRTRLPVVCFTPPGGSLDQMRAIFKQVESDGKAWVSLVRLRGEELALRACVTSYRTSSRDIDILVDTLENARTTHPQG